MRVIFSFIFSLVLLFNTAFAALPFSGKYFIESAGSSKTPNLIPAIDGALSEGLVTILLVLYSIGDVIAVCILAYIGIKILVSSPQQKAQLKASLFPYFTGLLLYMAGVPIAVFIINIFIKFF